MDGVAAIRVALVGNAALLELVPADCISAGALSLDAPLPSLMLTSISSNDRNVLSPGSRRHVRERVQVTILAKNYSQQKAILRAVRRAAADRLNVDVEGIRAVTIHTEQAGPDLMIEDPAIWCQPQDFLVTYLETR